MKVGYMTGVLMGDTSNQTSNGQSKAPDDTSVTNERQTFVEEEDENDGGDDNGGGDGGSYSFLNTKMIIYVVLALALFKAYKK